MPKNQEAPPAAGGDAEGSAPVPGAGPALAGLQLLRARCRAAREALCAQLRAPMATPALADLPRRRFLVTGIGVSEGPARCLAALLRRGGRCAAFLPLSAFAGGIPEGPFDTLVLFSQGLSPNARLALSRRGAFRDTLLVTGEGAPPPAAAPLLAALEREGAYVHRHPPALEDGVLLRVIGPALSTLAALRLAAALCPESTAALPLSEAAAVLAEPPPEAPISGADLEGPLAFVSCGDYGELCHGLRWKLLEGLWIREPQQLDVLQVAHGPFQQFFDGPITLIGLERPGAGEEPLWARLAQVLEPARHRLVPLRARLGGPLALLDHDAQCNALLLRALAERPRDLGRWPGQGRDGPLYNFCGAAPAQEDGP